MILSKKWEFDKDEKLVCVKRKEVKVKIAALKTHVHCAQFREPSILTSPDKLSACSSCARACMHEAVHQHSSIISLDFCSVCYCWSYTVMSSFWCRQHRRESEAGDQTAPVQLGGGYQVPGKIWHKLYR